MKKFSNYINEPKNVNKRVIAESIEEEISRFKVDDSSINYISAKDLEKYLFMANKFLSQETKDIVNWLIVNNDNYIAELSTDKHSNAMFGFFKNGVKGLPEDKKELWNKIKTVIGTGRGLEIPVFQKPDEFRGIINGDYGADYVIMQLNTERGKNETIKRYKPLIMKICGQWVGKSTLTYDDLMGAADEGAVYAMREYPRVSGNKAKDLVDKYNNVIMTKDEIEERNTVGYTFPQFLAVTLRGFILAEIQNASHLVRIPRSQQAKEKKATGINVKSHTVSGDKKIGHDENSRTVFDLQADAQDAYEYTNKTQIDQIWNSIYKEIQSKFDKNTFDIWAYFNGMAGYEQLKGVDIAKKYKISSSSVTYKVYVVNQYIRKSDRIMRGLAQIKELMDESLESYNDGSIIDENYE